MSGRSRVLAAALAALVLAALLSALAAEGILAWPATALAAARWTAIAGLAAYAAMRRSLTTWMLVCMVAGAELGYDAPRVATSLGVLGQIFLRLIKTIIGPLLFATLVVGIAGHADLRKVGRMGVKALIYFEVITTLALLIGLAAINLSRAGIGVHVPPPPPGEELKTTRLTPADMLLHAFPENIAKAVADGQVLQVVVFSVLFGVALALLTPERRRPMLEFAASLSDTMFKLTNIVMLFAPIGVGAAIAYTVGNSGLGVLVNLSQLLATLYVAIFAFLLLVLLPVALLARIPIRRFLRAVAEPVSIAFATTSSEAALPRAMEAMEGMGVPRPIVAFVMPTGYSFNLDGSALYVSLASIFVAQAAGMKLGFGQQLVMLFTLMLTSKGVAGVPRAGLVVLLATAAAFQLPTAPIFLLLGIDALMDMGRTALNVLGNCLATAVIARWEGDLGAAEPAGALPAVVGDQP
ncbi:MAG TPA: cation:dicarboxylase symporter family transporter [Thermoanaerobaculia bacterium]|nr:cation:dicarboxylase symporter family transporter [Thermoanaerobaculia bacterium]